jgi:prepilin-type processing-associated H-X9-DG protein
MSEESPHQPPASLEYQSPGAAGGPRRAGQWWFVAAVLAAGAASFGAVWAVFEYRAWHPPSAMALPGAGLGQSTLPPVTTPLASGLPPAQTVVPYDDRPGRVEEAQCATNLRHIAAALQAWANRHDWHLPDRLEDLVAAGLLDPQDLVCPTADALPSFESFTPDESVNGPPTTLPASVRSTYVYLGKGLTTPAGFDTVVLYEPPRHFGGVAMNVLFGDGSVRVLTGDDGRRLAASVATGRRPVEFPAERPGAVTRPAS